METRATESDLIPESFGAFGHRFYGVELRLHTPSALHAFFNQGTSTADNLSLEALCLRTALAHETRHFHDSMLSPFYQHMLFKRWTSANAVTFLKTTTELGANVLPIPVAKWLEMSKDARASWLDDIEQDLSSTGELTHQTRLRPPPLIRLNEIAKSGEGTEHYHLSAIEAAYSYLLSTD